MSNCKELWIARRKHQHLQTAGKDHSLGKRDGVGETGVGWDKFWLGQCPSVSNESPDDVFGEHVTTAFTGATRIIDARFASEISPKITF